MDILSFDYSADELAGIDQLRTYLNVANRILSARIARGLTQEELGRAAGSKQSRISELEAMKGNPRLDTLDRIARVLGLVVDLVPIEQVRQGQATSSVIPVEWRSAQATSERSTVSVGTSHGVYEASGALTTLSRTANG